MKHSVHGVLLAVDGVGVLLTGPAGSGKSWLALELLDRRRCHQLIADDAPQLSYHNGALYGSCPPLLQDLLRPRGLGAINVRQLFGAAAMSSRQRVDLIIDLCQSPVDDTLDDDSTRYRPLLGIQLPHRTLDLSSTPNRALWVECAARSHKLAARYGYSAEQDLRQRLRAAIQRDTIQGDTIQCDTIQCDTTQYDTCRSHHGRQSGDSTLCV